MSKIKEESLNRKGKVIKVFSAFPGTGKTWMCDHQEDYGLKILDSDSSSFSKLHDSDGTPNPEFPANYIEHIKANLDKYDMIFVSSHEAVRRALVENDIKHIRIFPELQCKREYLDRYVKRGSPDGLINLINTNWEEWINSMERATYGINKILGPGEYITDIINPREGSPEFIKQLETLNCDEPDSDVKGKSEEDFSKQCVVTIGLDKMGMPDSIDITAKMKFQHIGINLLKDSCTVYRIKVKDEGDGVIYLSVINITKGKRSIFHIDLTEDTIYERERISSKDKKGVDRFVLTGEELDIVRTQSVHRLDDKIKLSTVRGLGLHKLPLGVHYFYTKM